MSGLQEIVLILFLILAIFVLPRILGRGKSGPKPSVTPRLPASVLTGRMRLALALSVVWPLLTAAYFKPWGGDWVPYGCAGPGPVVLAWCAWWVREGFRRHRR